MSSRLCAKFSTTDDKPGCAVPRSSTRRSATNAFAAAQAIVAVQSAVPGTFSGNKRDAIEDNKPDPSDVTANIICAPLGRTMAAVTVAVGLNETARRVSVLCLDTNRLAP